jgi:hypothetical protein
MPEKHYFADGNTAKGYVSLLINNLAGLNRLFILKNGARKWNTALMEDAGTAAGELGYDAEYLHCALDQPLLDALILPQFKAGIVDATPPHSITPPEGASVQEIDLGGAYRLDGHEENLRILAEESQKARDKAYAAFAAALALHDDWEAVYIKSMDFKKADRLAKEFAEVFLKGAGPSGDAFCRRRFLGAATPDGAVDFIPELTRDMNKRYLMKGRPGTGKSTMLKKLAEAVLDRGIGVELYYCGFDPESVDMIIAPGISRAVFDSTAPHEYFICRENDELIDLYAALVRPGTDERYEQKLEGIQRDYRIKIGAGTAFLKKARTMDHAKEAVYASRADNDALEETKKNILKTLLETGG